jgi:hypothetical protein
VKDVVEVDEEEESIEADTRGGKPHNVCGETISPSY